MTIQEIIQEVNKLTHEEREQLKRVLDMLEESSSVTTPHKNRLSDLRGLGAEIWQDVDAQDYVNKLRDEWDLDI